MPVHFLPRCYITNTKDTGLEIHPVDKFDIF